MRVPQIGNHKKTSRGKTASNLVHPFVVERHPRRPFSLTAGLGAVPEIGCGQIPPELCRIPGPSVLGR